MEVEPGKIRKRRVSINAPCHAHFLTFSCYKGYPLLAGEHSRRWMIDSLERARDRVGFDLYAFVIMPEHVHVLARPRQDDVTIAAMLRGMKQDVARTAAAWLRDQGGAWLRRLSVRKSDGSTEIRFWQRGGGYDRNIFTVEAFRETMDYIHANPVRRGLVADAVDWPWSSARHYAGSADAVLVMDSLPFR